MAGSRYRVRDGIVVRRAPLPSGDVVVTLLSEDGKWRAVARKGRLLGGNPGRLSLFHDVRVQTYQRRDDDLAVVTQVTLRGALARLADPGVYPYAHLLAELADRLSVDVHHGEPLHAWVASGLRGLDVDEDPERVALVHAWMLLRVAGLAPEVEGAVGDGGAGARLDVAAGRLATDGEGVALAPDVAAGLARLVADRPRATLREALPDRPAQWRALGRYVAWHVDRVKSLEAIAGPPSGPAGDPGPRGVAP
ncbi:MAG: DNA repair protein RecO C-terminal domain-containing protein [Trueperaceae bacterium]|nr:DNA repair protein RecO C-terminal domain-containing protein [Trueperaceae bacterium]